MVLPVRFSEATESDEFVPKSMMEFPVTFNVPIDCVVLLRFSVPPAESVTVE